MIEASYFLGNPGNVIEMIAHYATAITGLAAFCALIFTRRALKMQRQNIQLNMYNSIVDRISSFQEKIPSKGEETIRVFNWHIGLFNEFENMIFLTNKKQMGYDQLMFYKDFMIDYVDDLKKSFPEVHKDFLKLSPHTFELLRNKYKEWTKQDAPF